ncbi:TonB family protein [Simiduia agarivorans]|uniref:Drug resistance signal transduction antirepressor-like protein n=1 Tax=Simiduia agarivorans (strain DSM 21679 / JCM 13881 / BCRC 17597 / SA1) TaxID=1117647 RepID=K4L136_SIMAS|nr:M56 family metallopeptidase [Simiduia agarivorans]AFU99882.1 drug resistance signal transduction antirepressor-like protein [Simiduia agarivorans SA1 = DSM 21679]
MIAANLLANLLIKPLLLTLLGAFFVRQAAHRSASHQHFLASALLAGLPLVLLAAFYLQGIGLRITTHSDHWSLVPVASLLQQPWVQVVIAAYLFGALFILFYLLLGLWLLRTIDRTAAPSKAQSRLDWLRKLSGISQPVCVKTSAAIAHPQVWGWRRPTLLVPTRFDQQAAAAQDLALLHELGHVARNDWGLSIAGRIICALFWPLLPVWWLAANQRQLAERATDDWVLATRNKPEDYADLLLASARTLQQDLPSQALNGSPLFQRVQCLLNDNLDRDTRDHQSLAAGLAITLGLSALLAVAHLQPVAPLPASHQITWRWLPQETVEPTLAPDDALTVAPLPTLLPEPQRPAREPMEQVRVLARADAIDGTYAGGPAADIQVGRPDLPGILPMILVTPDYPRAALRRGIEGVVRLGFSIDAEGRPVDIRVLQSPHASLTQAAIDAMQQSRYRAPLLNGQPVQLTGLTEDYRFQIQTDPPDT